MKALRAILDFVSLLSFFYHRLKIDKKHKILSLVARQRYLTNTCEQHKHFTGSTMKVFILYFNPTGTITNISTNYESER